MIRITCSSEGFIRCGAVHPKGTTDYPDDKFSAQEIKLMQRDPKLQVEIIEEKIEPSEKDDAKGKKKTKDKK